MAFMSLVSGVSVNGASCASANGASMNAASGGVEPTGISTALGIGIRTDTEVLRSTVLKK
jgi:hypothetical protein